MNVHIHNYVSPRQRPLTQEEAYIRDVAHALAKGEDWAIEVAAKEMSEFVPSNSILVPIPSSQGNTSNNLKLAQAISNISNCEVLDSITSLPRDSQKSRRHVGIPGHSEKEIETQLTKPCDTNKNFILIDNVRTTGATINSALRVLPCASYLVYAQAQEVLNWYDQSKVS